MSSDRKKAIRNLGSNLVLFSVQTVVSFLLTRFLIDNLGVEAYGMIPLANSLVPYLTLVSVGLSASLGRHFTVAWASGDRKTAASFMNAAFSVSMVAIVSALVLGVALSAVALSRLQIPAGLLTDTALLFAAVTIASALTVGRSLSAVVPFAEGRIDTDNIATLLDVLVRVAVVVGTFVVLGPKLGFVAAGIVAGAVAGLIVNVAVWRHLAPWLVPRLVQPQRRQLSDLLGTSAWVIVNQLGALLFLATDLVVINLILGPVIVGRYGSVMLWATFLRGLAGALSTFLTPLMVRKYARGDSDSLVATGGSAVKLVGLSVALPVGVIAGFSAPILAVWLGPEFVQMSPVLMALVLHLCVNLAVVPLFSVQISHNRLKVPGLMTVGAGVINIGLSVMWATVWPNALGVALGTAVALGLKNALFTPWYVARVQGVSPMRYFSKLAPVVVMTAVTFAVALWLVRAGVVVGLAGILSYGLAVAVVFTAVAWALLLTAAERAVILGALGIEHKTKEF